MPASTVHKVLVRHGLNRLDCLDRATSAPIRRMEMSRPGELVHIDVKKLGRIPSGGGWRVHGRAARPNDAKAKRARIGYAYVHSAVDAYSRLAYSEVLADEKAATAAAFWGRAAAFFATLDITVERVLPTTAAATAAGTSTPLWLASSTPALGLTARDQRQGRAVQPNPLSRMGLRPSVELRGPADPGLDHLAAPLQPSSPPHRDQGHAHEPCQQRVWALQLAARGRHPIRPASATSGRPSPSPSRVPRMCASGRNQFGKSDAWAERLELGIEGPYGRPEHLLEVVTHSSARRRAERALEPTVSR